MTDERLKTRQQKSNVIVLEYHGLSVSFDESGWFSATESAARYGKRPVDWLALDSTKEYIAALMRHLGISEKSSLIRAKRNSGTWLSPRLAVPFARWLDTDFAVWCDIQIDSIIRETHPRFDWKRARSEAASSFKVMNAVLQLRRQDQGKETAWVHYSNEARLVNRALTGEYKGIDRESLTEGELDLLAQLEERNAVLIGCGMDSATRKQILDVFIAERRQRLAA